MIWRVRASYTGVTYRQEYVPNGTNRDIPNTNLGLIETRLQIKF